MSLDDLKRRFVDEIKLRAYDDKYIDRNEEREILQIAIQQGISIDSARHALFQVCEHEGYVIESSLLKLIKAAELVGLQKFALEQTEPNFDLIEPRGIGRKPIELHRQFSIQRRRSFLDPAGELLGCMSRPIIQDERHGLHLATLCFYKQDGL